MAGFLVSLWLLPYYGFDAMGPWASTVAGIVTGCLLLLLFWSWAGLVIAAVSGRRLPFFTRLRGVTMRVLLPLMIVVGRILGLSKKDIRAAFIKVNNDMVLERCGKYPPERLLLLMPHCLQSSKCKLRLTYNIYNCKRCGKCPVAGLIELSDRYGIHLAIATGGTLARRIVMQRKPAMIIATACERDLASGIQDTYPLPVYGVLNRRPHGPCMDTLVSLEGVEEAMRRFVEPAALKNADARRDA
jgi:hypothetical protein